MITLYHCSPVRIEQFDFSNGVHFGGLYSALEAGLRKETEILHLHTVELSCKSFYETDDVGNAEAWAVEVQRAKELGCSVIKYRNKYEPDSTPSYLVLDGALIETTNIESLSPTRAEELIMNRFY